MNENTGARFTAELNGYFVLVVLNLVFASLAVAMGVQYMVLSVAGGTSGAGTAVTRAATAALSGVCFGLGIYWAIISAGILSGVEEIRSECRNFRGEVTPEVLTTRIIRTTAHYRENRDQVNKMRYICLLGGFCFLGLSILGGVQSVSFIQGTGSITLDSLRVLPPAVLALALGLTSLLSSFRFGNFKESWDKRLEKIAKYEEELDMRMGMTRK